MLSRIYFFNDTATTEIYTLSLHDALPISPSAPSLGVNSKTTFAGSGGLRRTPIRSRKARSEEHTSELQSHSDLVCRLLLEKKNTTPPAESVTLCKLLPVTTCLIATGAFNL